MKEVEERAAAQVQGVEKKAEEREKRAEARVSEMARQVKDVEERAAAQVRGVEERAEAKIQELSARANARDELMERIMARLEERPPRCGNSHSIIA